MSSFAASTKLNGSGSKLTLSPMTSSPVIGAPCKQCSPPHAHCDTLPYWEVSFDEFRRVGSKGLTRIFRSRKLAAHRNRDHCGIGRLDCIGQLAERFVARRSGREPRRCCFCEAGYGEGVRTVAKVFAFPILGVVPSFISFPDGASQFP